MPSQILTTTENNFTKGLITEATGLNFPENAATDCDNVGFTIVGNVTRREGIDFETNFVTNDLNTRSGKAISTYKWNNAGGDGSSQIIVVQNGGVLSFFLSSSATEAVPISGNRLTSTVTLSSFVASGGTFDVTSECTYSDGNGYLFVFNPNCDPIFCTYNAGAVTGSSIQVQIRDFLGVVDPIATNFRPPTLTAEHNYSLLNQGWTQGNPWSATSSTAHDAVVGPGQVWIVQAGLVGVTVGQILSCYGNIAGNPFYATMRATVTSYSNVTGVLVISVSGVNTNAPAGTIFTTWAFIPFSGGYITTWNTAEGNYPSNADVWWRFKNSSGVFDPATTQPNTSISLGNSPQGHFILNAFNQDRATLSGISAISSITTTTRPSNGCWFQGRVWYTGVNASQASTQPVGNSAFYTWSESIYFSQINVGTSNNFGNCFQVNDPTSEDLFDILPTDGGVIQINGSGSIYKLFPIQNGLLVFAANGVFFITGSQGIGFAANDYTVTKISSVEALSSFSFVDVQGLPYFWNEEGIYQVQPQQSGGLSVEPITVSTILRFYREIPKQSKRYARGVYNPIDYDIQWLYKLGDETSVSDRYSFDGILNYNTYNKAFFPYSVSTVSASINSINYVQGPGGSTSPDPAFKYLSSYTDAIGNYLFTFADEHDLTYTDWTSSGTPINFTSFFTTGYKLHGDGVRRFQMPYIYIYSNSETPTSYKIQGIWDYAITGNSGRWSTAQLVNNWSPNFGTIFRRHRIRGRGIVLQLKVTSTDGQPFDIMGWSTFENKNAGV